MKRAQYSQVLVILLASVGLWAALGADARSGETHAAATGAYAVTFHVLAPSTVPDGATILCSANVTPHLSILDRLSPDRLNPRAARADSAKGTARVVGSEADCTVQVPFSFSVSDPQKDAALSYRIDAFTSAGPAFLRTQQGIGVRVPQPGETANLHLNVSL
jgi:hypothetical protein